MYSDQTLAKHEGKYVATKDYINKDGRWISSGNAVSIQYYSNDLIVPFGVTVGESPFLKYFGSTETALRNILECLERVKGEDTENHEGQVYNEYTGKWSWF